MLIGLADSTWLTAYAKAAGSRLLAWIL